MRSKTVYMHFCRFPRLVCLPYLTKNVSICKIGMLLIINGLVRFKRREVISWCLVVVGCLCLVLVYVSCCSLQLHIIQLDLLIWGTGSNLHTSLLALTVKIGVINYYYICAQKYSNKRVKICRFEELMKSTTFQNYIEKYHENIFG